MTAIMVDLETWGKIPGSDIRSIGAVVFDPVSGTLSDEFYVAVDNPVRSDARPIFSDPGDPNADRRYLLFRDPDTVAWWADQSPEAQGAFDNPVDLRKGLQLFANWWTKQHDGEGYSRFWAKGPHFDEAILAACYRAVDLPAPWSYRAPRDCRTIYEAAGGVEIPFEGTQHNALDDAKHQARCVIEAYRKLRKHVTMTIDCNTAPYRELIAELVAARRYTDQRVTGLLEANNREVERRRTATGLLRKAGDYIADITGARDRPGSDSAEICDAIDEFLG